MNKLLSLVVIPVLLVACGAKNSGTSTTPAATDGAAAAKVAAAAPTNAELKQTATAAQETAGAEEPAGDKSLDHISAVPDNVALPGGRWKVGVNYKPVVPSQRTSAETGQVEVIEFLWLGCPHCAHLEPEMEKWAKQKPAYVKLVQEHVMWGPAHRAHGKLLYTLQALGRDDLIHKAFDEIHVRKNPLLSQKLDEAETLSIQLAFAKANGISEADFKREYNSFGVNTRLQKAEELTRRYKVEGVPLVIINGKYQTDVSMAGGEQQLLQLMTDLAAFEKGR